MKQYYRKTDDTDKYLMKNKKRVIEIKNTYRFNKKYFKNKILDVGCGGGILGFVVENKGHKYIGIDVNSDMIKGAEKYAKQIGSKNKFILGDATRKKIKGKFDTISCLGNGLCHITAQDFLKILENIKKNTKKSTYFILEYRDVVELLFKKQWKAKMIVKDKDKTRIIITKGTNTKKGEIYQESVYKSGANKIRTLHTMWSPFIMEAIMKAYGWVLVKRKRQKRWKGWLDIYKKVKK